MNERIKELWAQATFDGFCHPQIELIELQFAGQSTRYSITGEQRAKFAELIIKECVRHFNDDYQRDFDSNWREDLSRSINQHFGVKE